MTNILRLDKRLIGLGLAAPVLALAFAYLASAETAPTINTVIRNGSNATTTIAAFGTAVHADVHVSSTTAPIATSTVDFFVYSNQTCSGSPSIQNDIQLVNGRASSGTSTVSVDGISYKVHYDGESGVHPAADGECVSVVATGPNTAINITLSTTSAPVESSVSASSVLSGHTLHASGTVAYTVYENSSCTTNPRSAGTKTVSEGVVPNSDTLGFPTAGTFYWRAVYSGDNLNSGASSACLTGLLNVFATSTPRGRITVDKVVVPDGDPTSFHFNTGGTGYADFDLTGSSTPNTQELATGSYSINEANKSGWTTTAVCSRNGAAATSYSEGSSIILNNGDHITCTFTNTKSVVTPPNDDDDDGDDDDHQCGKDDDHGDNGNHGKGNNGLHLGWYKDLWKKDGFPFENGSIKKFVKSVHAQVGVGSDWDDDDNDDDEDNDDDDKPKKVKKNKGGNGSRFDIEARFQNRGNND
jgi:hypothetical protein